MDPVPKSWSFFLPAELTKAKQGEKGAYRLRGFASVEGLDHAAEEVLQDGLDWSYWKEHGFFKWNHGTAERPSLPEEFVAIPERAELVALEDGRKATLVEGHFLDTPFAVSVARLAETLQQEGRQLGLSIEGGIIRREGNRIPQAIVVDVALTPHPMHPEARATVEGLARSLLAALDVGHPAPADRPGAGGDLVPQSITPQPTRATLDVDSAVLRVLKRFPTLSYAEGKVIIDEVSAALAFGSGSSNGAGGGRQQRE